MAFYDGFCKCTKCCCCVNLRTGCIILGLISLLLRILFYVFTKANIIEHAFGNETSTFDTIVIILLVVISGGIGTVADVLLLLGVFQNKRNCVQLYLPIMFLVWVTEIIFFVLFFVLGYHWLDILDILLLGAFHVWCWFTAHSFNQEWNTLVPAFATSDDL